MADPKIRYDVEAQVTGSDAVRALAQGLESLDESISPLLAQRARELQAELARLGQQQGLIDGFRTQRTVVNQSREAFEAARDEATRLGREMAAIENPTRRQVAAFDAARTSARGAADEYQGQRLKLQTLRGTLSEAGISTDDLVAAQRRLREQQQGVQQQMQETAGWAKRLAADQRTAADASGDMGTASQRSAAGLREQARAAETSAGGLTQVAQAARQLVTVGVAGILGSQTGQLLADVATTADAFANLQARVRLVTGEGQAFATAWAGIAKVALDTNSSLDTTATLFAKVAEAGKELGLSQQAALSLTQTINQAVQLSGASAEASSAAVTQLVQGLQSGVLRGDEFNSVMEQAPRLAKALADSLGVTTGELRGLAETGKLTSETIITSLQSQRTVLEREFATLPATIGRALENLSTRWTLFVGNLNQSTGATALVAQGINGLADNLDNVAEIATRAGAVLVAALAVQGVGALRALSVQMLATGAGAGVLSRQLSSIPTAINIVVAAVGFEVGFQIGEMLRENSALARQLGVGVVAFFQNLVSDLQFLAESAKAIFTDDTIGQAFDRYRDRGRELDRIFSELWDEAAETPARVGEASTAAGQQLDNLGAAGQQAGANVAAGGAVGAAGVATVGTAANTAQQAINALVSAATGRLPAVAQAAAVPVEALQRIVDRGGQAVQLFGQQLPQAIGQLSGPELQRFSAGMVSALQQTEQAARRTAAELAEVGKGGASELARADRAAGLLRDVLGAVGRQAAQSLGVDLAAASSTVTQEFLGQQAALAALVSSLPALATQGVDTANVVRQALSGMLDGARNTAEIEAVANRMQALGVTGREAGELLAAALDKRTDAARTERDLQLVRAELQRLGRQGLLSGDEVSEGLRRVSGRADELRRGINSVAEAAKALGVTTQTDLQKTANTMAEAWALLRNSTQVALQDKIAAFARYRDAAIAANGGVETSEVRHQAQILQTQARAVGLGEAYEKAMDRAGKAADRATEKLQTQAQKVAELQRTVDAYGPGVSGGGLASLGGAQTARDAGVKSAIQSSFSIGQKSGTIGSTFTPPPDNSGDWEWVTNDPARPGGYYKLSAAGGARREKVRAEQQAIIVQAYAQAGLAMPGNVASAGVSTLGLPRAVLDQLSVDRATGQYSLKPSAAGAGTGTGTGSGSAAPGAQAGGAGQVTRHEVTINLGGQRNTFTVGSAEQAAMLVAMLQKLAEEQGRAGGGGP